MYSGLAYLGPWNIKKGTEPLKEIAQANYTSVDDRIPLNLNQECSLPLNSLSGRNASWKTILGLITD